MMSKAVFLIKLSITCLLLMSCDSTVEKNNKAELPVIVESTKHVKPNQQQMHTRDPVVAIIEQTELKLSQVDRPIQLALFDLQWRAYQLRKAQLKNMVSEKVNQAASTKPDGQEVMAELFLSPPMPPRVHIALDNRVSKGVTGAAVNLNVFCSYQSLHCAKLEVVLEEIEKQYQANISIRYYDFPQSFHRHAMLAANAVRCAAEQKLPWNFQSSVYAANDDFSEQRYQLIAQQLLLNEESFGDCLEQKKYQPDIERDLKLSKSLGFTSVPIVLINGLYIKGPQPLSVYQYYIDKELSQKGIKFSKLKTKASKLPLVLRGVMLDQDQLKSIAIIESFELEHTKNYQVSDRLLKGVMLVAIEKDRVFIDNQGVREYLLLESASNEPSSLEQPTNTSTQETSLPGRKRQVGLHNRFADKSKLILSRSWLDSQLAEQARLEQHFKNAEHVVEGVHLIRLEQVEQVEFYQTLGLKSGDVIMRVGEQWVHEQQNPLWDSLRNQDSVKVTLMRNGRPVNYYYQVKN